MGASENGDLSNKSFLAIGMDVGSTTVKATVVDPKINAEFAFHKGSSPVRIDVPTDKLDACNTLVLDSLKKPGFSVENPFYIGDGDWINSVWNTMYTFQGDPKMSTDDAIAMLKKEYAAVFK